MQPCEAERRIADLEEQVRAQARMISSLGAILRTLWLAAESAGEATGPPGRRKVIPITCRKHRGLGPVTAAIPIAAIAGARKMLVPATVATAGVAAVGALALTPDVHQARPVHHRRTPRSAPVTPGPQPARRPVSAPAPVTSPAGLPSQAPAVPVPSPSPAIAPPASTGVPQPPVPPVTVPATPPVSQPPPARHAKGNLGHILGHAGRGLGLPGALVSP